MRSKGELPALRACRVRPENSIGNSARAVETTARIVRVGNSNDAYFMPMNPYLFFSHKIPYDVEIFDRTRLYMSL
jgi:hypothetical protein